MASSKRGLRNQVRIIGGRWRSRRLAFPAAAAVRPTPDRVRETLFNWLQPIISGACCLDLFAGSGALGLEALSRGASRVVFLEQDPDLAAGLKANLLHLEAESGSVVVADARDWLERAPRRFDIVFLDPPFGAGFLEPCCKALAARPWLAPGARIYTEHAVEEEPEFPSGWTVLRRLRAGRVACELSAPAPDAAHGRRYGPARQRRRGRAVL